MFSIIGEESLAIASSSCKQPRSSANSSLHVSYLATRPETRAKFCISASTTEGYSKFVMICYRHIKRL